MNFITAEQALHLLRDRAKTYADKYSGRGITYEELEAQSQEAANVIKYIITDRDVTNKELAEIKKRAEEAKKEYETAIKETDGTYIQTVLKAIKEEKLLIDYILKGNRND